LSFKWKKFSFDSKFIVRLEKLRKIAQNFRTTMWIKAMREKKSFSARIIGTAQYFFPLNIVDWRRRRSCETWQKIAVVKINFTKALNHSTEVDNLFSFSICGSDSTESRNYSCYQNYI
jgi:hypothetical protein